MHYFSKQYFFVISIRQLLQNLFILVPRTRLSEWPEAQQEFWREARGIPQGKEKNI